MFYPQQQQSLQQNIQAHQIISEIQNSNMLVEQLHNLRLQSNRSPKQIILLIDEWYEKLLKICMLYDQNQGLINQRQFVQTEIRSLEHNINFFIVQMQQQFVEHQIQYQPSNFQKINNELQQKFKELEKENQQLQTILQQNAPIIQNKQKQLAKIKKQYQKAVQHLKQLKLSLVDKKHQTIHSIKTKLLQSNWQQQKKFITEMVKSMSSLKQQLSVLKKAKLLMEQKMITHQNTLKNMVDRNEEIAFLKKQNLQIQEKLKTLKLKKDELDEIKTNFVIEKQCCFSADLAQSWDQQKRDCQNLLLKVLTEINMGCNSKNLQDIDEVIKQAQVYFERMNNNSQLSHSDSDNWQHMSIEQQNLAQNMGMNVQHQDRPSIENQQSQNFSKFGDQHQI